MELRASQVCGGAQVSISPQPKPERQPTKPRRRIPRVRAKGKRKKVSRREEQKRLFQQCDRLWSFFTKARDGWKCMSWRPHSCTRVIQAAHYFTKKSHPHTRFEPWAGISLCSGEHVFFDRRAPELLHEHARQEWGEELYLKRMALANTSGNRCLEDVRSELVRAIGLIGAAGLAEEKGLLEKPVVGQFGRQE